MSPLQFPYGKKNIGFDATKLSHGEIFLSEEFEADKSEKEIIIGSLKKPSGSPPLPSLLKRKKPKRITVVMSDVTRVTGSHVFLPLLINIFKEEHIPPKNITYLIAAGIHPPCNREQIESLFGINRTSALQLKEERSVYEYRLSNGSRIRQHNAKGEKGLAMAGCFSDGTPFKVSQTAMESDFLILTGAVTLHYLAGFGGGGKAILPGISSYENCMDLHKLSLCPHQNRKNSRVSLGNLSRNPFQERIREAVKMMKPAFALNTVCDDHKRIIFAASGHWEKAFQAGARFIRKVSCRKSDTLFDAAMISCGGFPKDINFIQSHKSFENNVGLVKEEGALLLIAECKEKIGNPTFLNWFRFESEKEFVRSLKGSFEINGQTALATFQKCRRVRTYMITGLSENILKKMNIRKVKNIEEFIRVEKLAMKKVALVPKGSTTWRRHTS